MKSYILTIKLPLNIKILKIYRYYCDKYTKKFSVLNKNRTLRKGINDKNNIVIFCSEIDDIDKIYQEQLKYLEYFNQ